MVEIHFGALCDPIIKQLESEGYLSKKDSERLQAIADAIVMLHIHGIIPDSIKASAQKKLMKKIAEATKLINP